MAYSANGYNFPDKTLSRVKYDLEYDSSNDLYRFKGKPQEVIVAVHTAAPDVFFNSATDYTPIWFDSSVLDYIYGDQVFFDVQRNRNLIVLPASISDPCLTIITDYIKYRYWALVDGFWGDGGVWMDSETWID